MNRTPHHSTSTQQEPEQNQARQVGLSPFSLCHALPRTQQEGEGGRGRHLDHAAVDEGWVPTHDEPLPFGDDQ